VGTMAIYDDVTEQMKAAMRAKDKPRLSALRNIRAAFINKRKESNAEVLTDEQCIAELRTLAKQRKDSVQSYTEAGREDLAEAEALELTVIEAYLPSLADEETTRAWVEEAIAAAGATEVRHVGKVMGQLMRAHRGEIDGGLAKRLAAELLQG
jgi:uncharacterized protein YqeY